MIYTWSFGPFEILSTPEKIVKTVHWRLSGEDEESGVQYSIYDSAYLGDPDPDNFIEYENLTQNQILQWVLGSMVQNNETLADVEARLKQKTQNGVNQILHPDILVTNPPWS